RPYKDPQRNGFSIYQPDLLLIGLPYELHLKTGISVQRMRSHCCQRSLAGRR
ncbi:hypothetical protein KI387_034204, partial [Taxus chinensis]